MPQSIQQVIVAEILQAIVHLLLVPVVLQLILIATLKRKRKRRKRRSLKKRRNKRATLQHQAPKPLVAQISQVARVRKSQSQVVVSLVKVHLHQAHNQSLAPIKKTTITTTTTTEIKKEAQPAQRVLVRVLVQVLMIKENIKEKDLLESVTRRKTSRTWGWSEDPERETWSFWEKF